MSESARFLIDKLYGETSLSREEYAQLIAAHTNEDAEYLFSLALRRTWLVR